MLLAFETPTPLPFGAEAPTGPEGLPPKAGDGMWEQKPPQDQKDQKVYPHYRRRDVGAEAPTGPEGLPPTIGDGMWEQKPPQDQKVYIPKSRRRDVGAEAPTGPEGLPPTIGDGMWEQKPPQDQKEDEAGSLQGAVEALMAWGRRRRLLALAAAIRRTIIRHLALLLDLSAAMMDRDMRPTRFDLMLQYAREFVVEWFDHLPYTLVTSGCFVFTFSYCLLTQK
ncbi:hypothetical protein EDD22DRAFT_956457 [Suillus occidentalis]|nr:hypothetical protein EDD22DRAFT_956457 [Suillus occidentalis]